MAAEVSVRDFFYLLLRPQSSESVSQSVSQSKEEEKNGWDEGLLMMIVKNR